MRRMRSQVLHRPIELAQYTSVAFADHLLAAGIDASVGSVCDAYDNALAESTIGLHKAGLINRQGRWHAHDQVENLAAELRRVTPGHADLSWG